MYRLGNLLFESERYEKIKKICVKNSWFTNTSSYKKIIIDQAIFLSGHLVWRAWLNEKEKVYITCSRNRQVTECKAIKKRNSRFSQGMTLFTFSLVSMRGRFCEDNVWLFKISKSFQFPQHVDPNILQGSQRATSINQKWNHVFSDKNANCFGLGSIWNKNEDCSRNLIKSGGVRVVDTEQILTRIFCIKSIWRKVFCRAGGKSYKKKKGNLEKRKDGVGWEAGPCYVRRGVH